MFVSCKLRKSWAAPVALLVAGLLLVLGALHLSADRPAASDETDGIALPIVMYHGLLKEKSRQGAYIISPDLLESDLKYLKDHGYETVVVQDLLDYVHKGTPLPEKPVMLTFDDGYYNNYVYAYPLMQQYACKMVLSPIGRYTEEYSQTNDNHANYSHVTWTQLKEMIDSGWVEVQNHSYNMHSTTKRQGAKKASGESVEQYTQALTEDALRMQEAVTQNLGVTPTAFTYPFGAYSKESLSILKNLGFQSTLTCESRINTITRDPECLYGLGRYLRPSGVDTDTYFTQTVKLS